MNGGVFILPEGQFNDSRSVAGSPGSVCDPYCGNQQGSALVMERWFEMPQRYTFKMPKVRKWVEDRLEGAVLNLFGGETRIAGAVHNDINPTCLIWGDLQKDAYDVAEWDDYADLFDTVIFDPPFSAHQAVVSYGIKKAQKVTHARDVVDLLLKRGGRVLSLGFNSTGMSVSRGYAKESLALVNQGGSHNDIILLCERRV